MAEQLVLGIRLTADGQGLVGEVRLSREEIEKLTKATKEAGGASSEAAEDGKRYNESLKSITSAASATALAIGAVATALALKVKGVIETSAELARMNETTGRAVEWIGRMKYVADQSDVSFKTLLQTYQRLPRAIVEAFGESSESGRALRAIGLDPAKLKDTDQAMLLIADRFRQVRDPMVQAALAEMIFKERGEELIPFLKRGAEGIRQLYEESGRYSTITGESARQAQELKRQLVDLQYGSGQLAQSIATDLVPWLNRLVASLNAANAAGGGIKLWMQTPMGDEGARLNENIRTLEKLKQLRADLSKDTFANRANEAIFGDVATLDRQIAFFEKQNQMLRLVQQQQALAGAGPAYRDEGARFTPRGPGLDVSLDDLARGGRDSQGKKEMTLDDLLAKAAQKRLEVQDAAEQAADRAAEQQRKRDEDDALRQNEKFAGDYARMIASIELSNMTELEILTAHLDERSALVNAAYARGLFDEEEFERRSKLVLTTYERDKSRIQKAEEQSRESAMATAFANMSTLMRTGNQTLFRIGQTFAYAETIVRTNAAAMKAFDDGARISYWVGAAYSAAVWASGAVALHAISTANPDRGGGGGGAAGVFSANPNTGVPDAPIGGAQSAPPSLPIAAPQPTVVNIHFVGGEDRNYSYKEIVEELIPLINEAIGHGATINVTTDL